MTEAVENLILEPAATRGWSGSHRVRPDGNQVPAGQYPSDL